MTEFKTFDPTLTAACRGGRLCVAYRFRSSGKVSVEPPDPASPPAATKNGHALVLGSDLSADYGGADQRGSWSRCRPGSCGASRFRGCRRDP